MSIIIHVLNPFNLFLKSRRVTPRSTARSRSMLLSARSTSGLYKGVHALVPSNMAALNNLINKVKAVYLAGITYMSQVHTV